MLLQGSVNASVPATFASLVQPSLALTCTCDVAVPCPSHLTKDRPEVGEVLPPAPAPRQSPPHPKNCGSHHARVLLQEPKVPFRMGTHR